MWITLHHIMKWCDSYGYSFERVEPINFQGISKTFNKYNAMRKFYNSNYDYMIWLDTDIIVQQTTPCIVRAFPNKPFAASILNKNNIKPNIEEYSHFSEFIKLIDRSCSEGDIERMTTNYFNTGVMLISKQTIIDMFESRDSIINVYKKIERRHAYTNTPHTLLREEFMTNYIIYKNNIPMFNLPKQWHSSIGHLHDHTSNRKGHQINDYILHFDIDDKDAVIWNYMYGRV
ncbi:hypothetical protein CL622_03670 [archaeon]|nr:hypothetical protein [archaeon]